MDTFAIVETGGKQYRVKVGDAIRIETLNKKEGDSVLFNNVLLVSGNGVKIGTPYVKGAVVEGIVSSLGRAEKKIVFRYHSKTRYRKLKGHRQPYAEVSVKKITV